ncbi:hypothetical protein B9G69_003290 [Bdellovibrio sp. SKB1291214]|uniref:hypothetical protein n=1 Tax=Bdellovibrio sp. SKB1291214 TaxID=1732569 RepID=UPI000B516AC8|nr:hypothetical protein [Bdellovibrio sp. SKB1291214]UYL09596.1 hypothetical protein B9G69_003290 [Bdellovibrio sp. SKB1291214]
MKYAFIALLLLTSSFAHAAVRSVRTKNGCQFFDETKNGIPRTDILWSGSCPNGKADGTGYIEYFDAEDPGQAITFRQYFEFKNGILSNPYFGFASFGTVEQDLIITQLWKAPNTLLTDKECSKIPQCRKILNAVKSDKGLKPDSSTLKTNKSNGGGAITKPAYNFMKSSEGYSTTCDEATLVAALNNKMAELNPELHSEGMCLPAKAGAKVFYFGITLIEKSCPPDMYSQVADMEDLRARLKEALDIINFSCNDTN